MATATAAAVAELYRSIESGSVEGAEDIADACERVELSAGYAEHSDPVALDGVLRPVAALQVLALLLLGDLPAARFTCERFDRSSEKMSGESCSSSNESADLTSAAQLCKDLHAYDLSAFFSHALATQWESAHVRNIATSLVEAIRARHLALLPKLFGEKIPLKEVSRASGMDNQAAKAHCLANGWSEPSTNDSSRMDVSNESNSMEWILAPPIQKTKANAESADHASLNRIHQLSSLVMELDRKLFTDIAAATRDWDTADLASTPEMVGHGSTSSFSSSISSCSSNQVT